MAKTTRTYRYQPTDGLMVPDITPGDTVEARDDAHAAQLDAHPCFTVATDDDQDAGDGGTKPSRKRRTRRGED